MRWLMAMWLGQAPLPAELGLSSTPMVVGEPAIVTVTGGTVPLEPGVAVWFMVGQTHGAGPCPMYLDGRCWGITSPNVAHVVRTDSNGVASWQVAPETLIGASPMSFQAAASGPNGVRLSYPLTVKVFHTAPTEVCEDIAPTMSRDADDMGCVRCSVAGPGT